MIFQRALFLIAAISAVAAAAAVAVFAAALALYAVMRDIVGPAGAAATVMAAAALLLLLAGLLAAVKTGLGRRRPSLAEQVAAFVRERPLAALAAALGAGFLALRNPQVLAAFLREIMEPRDGRGS